MTKSKDYNLNFYAVKTVFLFRKVRTKVLDFLVFENFLLPSNVKDAARIIFYFKQFISGFLLVCCLSACNKSSKKVSKLRHYQIQVTPDSVVFGQNKVVILSIKNLKAADVINLPEKDTSIEITYNLEVTNNHPINGKYIFVDPSNFRLVLDNHHKLTHAFYNSLGADPQSTTISVGNIFNLPAKSKPVALDLFFADSVASMKINLK